MRNELTKREMNWILFAEHLGNQIKKIKTEFRPLQEQFMSKNNLTLEQYRTMNETEQKKIDEKWRKFINW